MKDFKKFCQQLEAKIQNSYESGVTMEDAEKLAGEFLYAQMQVSEQLKTADLDSRMKKSGLKAVKAAVYLDTLSKAEKRPTEAQAEHLLATNEVVQTEQDGFDKAEVDKTYLERCYDIFVNAHIYYRGVAKGRFD